jgi:hypothetical protein
LDAQIAVGRKFGGGFSSASPRRGVGYALDGISNAAHRRAKIWQVNHGQQQANYPKDMQMGEKRNQSKNGNDLELQFVGPVRHALGQAVQLQVQIAYPKDHHHNKDAHYHYQDVRPVSAGNEKRQMMRGDWVHLISQLSSPTYSGTRDQLHRGLA